MSIGGLIFVIVLALVSTAITIFIIGKQNSKRKMKEQKQAEEEKTEKEILLEKLEEAKKRNAELRNKKGEQ
jgi:hypothetical protein|nr:MAG TPA: Plasma membrane calcium-transporting ATPase 1 protein, STRUCTURAL PROTEIN [Caudoviricetes sp.]